MLRAAFWILALWTPVPAFAQAITAKVIGTVTDPTGAVVPTAVLTLRNQQTTQTRDARTDSLGNYEFSFVPAGTYTLAVSAVGFQRAEVSEFPLSVDQVARIDVKMSIGQAAETVQVSAASVLLQTENATVGTVIDAQKVVDLPLNGRSFVQLATLTPGVNPGTPGSITVRRLRGSVGQAVAMSANGARDTQNRFYYDGIEAMDLDGMTFSFSPSVDAINEFKVQSSTYSAENGGAPGGHVNLTTKSGTNSLHGTLWEFNRNDAFTALNGFQPRVPGAKPPRLNRNQYGANIGGPVLAPKYNGRNKTFFFFNWESGRQISGTFGATALVPPALQRAGNFSGVTARVVDPATGLQFPGNIIPAARIAPYARKFLDGFVPAPNANEPGINYRGPAAAAPIDQDQYVARIDHSLSKRDTLSGSYTFNTQADNTVPVFVFDSRGNRARTQNLSLSEIHIFSSAIVNEFRAGWNRFFEHEFFGTTGNPQYDIANLIGIAGVSPVPRNFGPPTFTAGYTLPSLQVAGPRDRLNQIWQVTDNVSYTKHRHFMKFGGLVARRNWTFDQVANGRGTFTFNGTVTAGGGSPTRDNQFAEFLLGLATTAQVSAQFRATRMNNLWHGYYFQDDWKVTPNFTVNLGMRYEYFQPPIQRGKEANFDTNGFYVTGQSFVGFPDIADSPNHPPGLVYPDRNNWGPRVGFAWSVPGVKDMVIRSGYGIYYSPEVSNSWTTLTANPPIVSRYSFTGTPNNPIAVATAFEAAKTPDLISSGNAIDPHNRDTYNQQWNFTIQKQLPKKIYLDAGYVGAKGTNLVVIFDANRPFQVLTPGPTVAPIANRRPLRGFDNIQLNKSIGNSTYHALQAKLERRMSGGLTILGAYTWSKSLSNGDTSSIGGGTFLSGVQDYFNLRGDKSVSVFDVAHRLSGAAIYELPVFRNSGSRAMRALLGGWQIGTIVTEQTGFAASLAGVVDTTSTGVVSRPNAVLGQNPMLSRDQRTRARWFNTAAFTLPVNGSFGNAPREALHLPGLNQVDSSIFKNFRFTETRMVQFRTEFFNFFNHVNLGAPGLDVRQPDTFGRITSTVQGAAGMPGDARVIQFALKLLF
jgi:hypothetical protein